MCSWKYKPARILILKQVEEELWMLPGNEISKLGVMLQCRSLYKGPERDSADVKESWTKAGRWLLRAEHTFWAAADNKCRPLQTGPGRGFHLAQRHTLWSQGTKDGHPDSAAGREWRGPKTPRNEGKKSLERASKDNPRENMQEQNPRSSELALGSLQ